MGRTNYGWTALVLLGGCGAHGSNGGLGGDDAGAADVFATDVRTPSTDVALAADTGNLDAGLAVDAALAEASVDAPVATTDVPADVPVAVDASASCTSSRACPGQVCDTSRHVCVDCLADADCTGGTVCGPDDRCRAPACASGPSTCTADGRVHTCDPRVGFVDTACPSGSTCTAGHCTGLACTPGASFCGAGAERRTCSADGTSFSTTLCPSPPHATGLCVTDGCGLRCDDGFADCNGVASDGCEVDTRNDTANCGGCRLACAAGCACAASTCSCGGGLTCSGASYDVDGLAADGCEVADDTVAGHAQATPTLAPPQGCSDSVFGTLTGGRIVSDARVHSPAPQGFDATTGSSSDWWGVRGTGGSLCADNFAVTLTTSGGSSAVCYRLTVITDRTTASGDVSGSGSVVVSNLGLGLYTDNTIITFHVEKTCTTTVRENVSYTLSFHL